MKKELIAGASIAALLIALAGVWRFAQTRNGPAPVTGELSVPDVPASAVVDEVDGDEREVRGARVSIASGPLNGRVIDPAGKGVEGVEILWAVGAEDVAGSETSRQLGLTVTDWDGAFAFVGTPDAARRASVIWASHENYLAEYAIVPPEPVTSEPLALVLDPATRRVARVRSEGKPVRGARILQRGSWDSAEGDLARALQVFSRTYETDGEGAATIVTLPGAETVVARQGTLASEPYVGPSRGDVTLDLVPTFLAGGVVFLNEPRIPSEAAVSVTGLGAPSSPILARARVAATGEWGPVRVPLTGVDTFAFDVAGGDILPLRRELASPEPDTDVRVDFDASVGIGVTFLVLGQDKEALAGASAVVHWREGERWVSSKSAPSDEDGRVLVRGCPSAPIYFDVRCTGYASYRGGPFLITSPEDSHWTVQLHQASRLVGQCVHGGDAVPTFKVLYWPTGDRGQIRRTEVRDDPSGEFELDDVRPGDLSLVVASEGLAQSGIHQVALTAGERTELLIELSTAQDGVGRVVDAVTNEPIRGAEVKVFVSGVTALDQLGEPVVTGADGGFRIPGFGSDPVFFSVAADGYSLHWADAKATSEEEVDLGVLALWRKQPLTLRLRYGDTDDPTRFLAECGRTILPQSPFPSDGVLRLEEFDVGAYDFLIEYPDGSCLSFHREFRPGEPWDVEIDVTGGSQLAVHVVEPSGDLPLPLWVAVETPTGDDLFRGLSEQGRAELSRLPAGRCMLEIYDEAGQTLAVEAATLTEGAMTSVRIELEEPRRFRVVDADGNAVAAATIWFDSTDGSGASFHTVVDAKGEAVARGLPDDDLVAHVLHPTLGTRASIPIHAGSVSDETVVLELRARETLPVTFMDGAMPATGVTCVLRVHENELEIGYPRVTDEGGRVTWEPLAEGDYDVAASHPDYWPVEQTVRANSQTRIVQIRRRGVLELDVDSLSGREEDLPVELFAVDFGLDVAKWVAAGRIEVSSGLRTGEDGRLRVPGLPHGAYQWTVLTSEGPVEGDVVVPPAGTASERVLVP